jgi:hypothetical protein
LNRRAFYSAVAAKYTTVAGKWLYNGLAFFTLVKVLTGINRHYLFFLMAANRAGNN